MTHQLQATTDSYNNLLAKDKQEQGGLADLNGRLEAQSKEFGEKLDQLRTKNIEQQHDLDALRAANKQLSDEKDGLLRAADRMREQLEQQNLQTAALQKKMDEQTSSLDLFMDPSTRVAPLVDPKGESKAVAKVYWNGGRKTGFMVVSNCRSRPAESGQMFGALGDLRERTARRGGHRLDGRFGSRAYSRSSWPRTWRALINLR